MTVQDKMMQLVQCKQDIKQALIDGGVDMTGIPFTEYAGKVSKIGKGGGNICFGSNNRKC